MASQYDSVDIDQVLNTLGESRDEADTEFIIRAYEFAREAHEGQSRLTGAPYISHPLAVANILAGLGMDDATICAGLLHDVVEDCEVALGEVEGAFGATVARIVDGVTKITRIDFRSKKRAQAGNLRKMILAMAEDIRVIVVKLADRLHNMETLQPFRPEQQRSIADETLYIFAPLAHRLGMQRIKWELEDTAFRFLQPEEYRDLIRKVNKTRKQRVHEVEEVIGVLRQRLRQEGIEAEIQGRPKHLYSIYTKMLKQQIDFDRIHDLNALRVIVNNVRDCYSALGVVQNLWMPLAGMFTDYIAKPKPNRYQSLHTKVLGPRGEPIEVQIRTWDMHREAEYGIAAHWQYKEGKPGDSDFERKVSWLRQLHDMEADIEDDGEFLESLRLDLFKDEVFVFTPASDVIDLPLGGTPVDFAYRVHSQVGDRCAGARVNGRLVPLSYELQNGDICEVLTSKNAKPRAGWLEFVRTSHAKGRIKSALRKAGFEENLSTGRARLERAAKSARLEMAEVNRSGVLERLSAAANYKTVEEYIAAVGYGDFSPESVVERVRDELDRDAQRTPPATAPLIVPKRWERTPAEGVTALGRGDVLFRLSRCCSPLPGDPIVGYITRGRGITVHRQSCPNMSYYREHEPTRVVEVQWDPQDGATYRARIEVDAFDRVGLLNDVTGIISSHKTNITRAEVSTASDRNAKLRIELDVQDAKRLQALMREVRQLSDVRNVRRVKA
ncbi:MAG: (p)ppGpp synthetase [Armatimonadetes bacterium CG_4_10_14_3_um_filter_66_18]|nr:bifunctional (p)ppGpp synthetase/guanosine-3',5'-bis(diphosphate) 3'-pyrophosphohydrolase [Armatimonadota bacterium]OIO93300.1 MAG: (p)ppGpp synthetase [Armatimonadetes bacterium CG2_30_66_41]PIU95884.1 MAG: (p)ppGpp synthetase [Armatimonadetes bacterium CG06_land_8_20_14_3_00_66_21]PIX47890.1 MAG: (p)ppGpp synthetase [Armatimonadetes bacterium CG_4_8_14_3_um_filter_66_20]PIY51020.1 MAG: (p)ppGpp synthetase [Armatimonadetes bacterium CG_4_10_14_3_um_filter_66_18]PIZ49354.1 MAG: (p)ppGpp syn